MQSALSALRVGRLHSGHSVCATAGRTRGTRNVVVVGICFSSPYSLPPAVVRVLSILQYGSLPSRIEISKRPARANSRCSDGPLLYYNTTKKLGGKKIKREPFLPLVEFPDCTRIERLEKGTTRRVFFKNLPYPADHHIGPEQLGVEGSGGRHLFD